jgi:hypothetical protein
MFWRSSILVFRDCAPSGFFLGFRLLNWRGAILAVSSGMFS